MYCVKKSGLEYEINIFYSESLISCLDFFINTFDRNIFDDDSYYDIYKLIPDVINEINEIIIDTFDKDYIDEMIQRLSDQDYNEIFKYLKYCIANGTLTDQDSCNTIFFEINKKFEKIRDWNLLKKTFTRPKEFEKNNPYPKITFP
jgi:hypothetical protein